MNNEERNLAQAKAVARYIDKAPMRCTGVLSTGFGKSKVAIDILKHKMPKKVIILVNSTILRDESWKTEFYKFEFGKFYEERVTMVTYQAAYKWTPSFLDLTNYFVIADEVDFAGDTDELAKFFTSYPNNEVLGLTGFITSNKQAWFIEHLPVFIELTASEAQDMGILNKTHFVFVKYDLSQNRNDITVEYTKHGSKKTFTQSESSAYDYADLQTRILIGESKQLEKKFEEGELTYEEYLSAVSSNNYRIRQAISKRNELLSNSIAGVRISQALINYKLNESTDNKIIVFSQRTAQSAKICGVDKVYNGSIHKKAAAENFSKFCSGDIKVLGVCSKVNRGANIANLNIAIMESFYGSDTNAVQKIGRMLRLEPNETATIIVLLPYYMRHDGDNKYSVQETQQVTWAYNMLRSTDVKSSEIWDYRTVKEN